ncbi:hypothetical protein NE626_16035, partial [Intestinimonas massiliensis]|uniref:hypothetical protein n=1 Tax=Intestinimonas massiliensis (ex Afouda et al. 2020) TaxID=1673721 RepID=UPI002109C1E9
KTNVPEIRHQVIVVKCLREMLYQKCLPLIRCHEIPLAGRDGLPQYSYVLRWQLLENSVQLVGIIQLLLSSGIENAVNVNLSLLVFHWDTAGPNAG